MVPNGATNKNTAKFSYLVLSILVRALVANVTKRFPGFGLMVADWTPMAFLLHFRPTFPSRAGVTKRATIFILILAIVTRMALSGATIGLVPPRWTYATIHSA